MSLPAKLSEEEIVAHLNAMSREPFREGLAALIAAMPPLEALKEWAMKSPEWTASAAGGSILLNADPVAREKRPG